MFREGLIATGDYVMAVKNNYHWLDAQSKAGFIANGDVFEVQRIGKEVEHHGYQFVHVSARMVDYPEEPDVDLVLWIDSLTVDGPSMAQADTDKLYRATLQDYEHLPTKAARREALEADPYYRAVQVKFAYAMTCHKAQGGQWPVVIVDQGFLSEDMLDEQYVRWLYTAVSRAQEKLYLLNFDESVIAKIPV